MSLCYLRFEWYFSNFYCKNSVPLENGKIRFCMTDWSNKTYMEDFIHPQALTSLTFTSFPGFLSFCLINVKKRKGGRKIHFLTDERFHFPTGPSIKWIKNLYETKICHHSQKYEIWCHHRWSVYKCCKFGHQIKSIAFSCKFDHINTITSTIIIFKSFQLFFHQSE